MRRPQPGVLGVVTVCEQIEVGNGPSDKEANQEPDRQDFGHGCAPTPSSQSAVVLLPPCRSRRMAASSWATLAEAWRHHGQADLHWPKDLHIARARRSASVG